MKDIKKILIIIQRSNGDVLLSHTLIKTIYEHYNSPLIDLLINDDTQEVGKLLPYVNQIILFSYKKKNANWWSQEKKLFQMIFSKYDLSISLTASDRSVIYSKLAGKISISAVEKDFKKNWWKKLFLDHYYLFDSSEHILINNLKSLKLLEIQYKRINEEITASDDVVSLVKRKLKKMGVGRFYIFHPSAQYKYKVYPSFSRNQLLKKLSNIATSIVVTGGKSEVDYEIKKQIPSLPNLFNLIGETSLEEFIVLSKLSQGYIGMDTLNMHIAASQNKKIFAIFGPTNLKMWSPWSSELSMSASHNEPTQKYGNVTLFQANLPCVACGQAGCDDNHGKSICLDNISPEHIYEEIKVWHHALNNLDVIPVVNNDSSERKVLLYIVYGEDQIYYDGAIFSLLTFKNWISESDEIEIVVLTEKPDNFLEYPITVIPMTNQQKMEWSFNGKYHFRIKNRGLAFVMDQLELKGLDKILFIDTDTYFHKSPMPLFDLINTNQALFYLNEGLIFKRKRFKVYVNNLKDKEITVNGLNYNLSTKSALWGSLMVGIMPNMRHSLEWSDLLMQRFLKIVPSHTIEPFSLSESLLRDYDLVEGKKYVSLYSTSRKKEYAKSILLSFFEESSSMNLQEKIDLAQEIKIKRPLGVVLKQRFFSIFK